MSEYTTKEAIVLAQEGDVSGFRNAVESILMSKIKDAVELKKVSIASSFMEEGCGKKKMKEEDDMKDDEDEEEMDDEDEEETSESKKK